MSMIWSVLSVAVQLHKGNSCWNITGGLPVSPSIYHTHSGQLSPEREDTTKTSARWPRTHNPSDVCTAVMSSLLGEWQSAPLWCAPLRVLPRACCFLFCVIWWEADMQTGNDVQSLSLMQKEFFFGCCICASFKDGPGLFRGHSGFLPSPSQLRLMQLLPPLMDL